MHVYDSGNLEASNKYAKILTIENIIDSEYRWEEQELGEVHFDLPTLATRTNSTLQFIKPCGLSVQL